MNLRPFGASGLCVSELGLGCASYWGLPRFEETSAVALVHEALDLGVTFFDTGAGYSRGEAEPRLGRALRGRMRDELIISTKAGTRFDGGRLVRDFSLGAIEASVEASRRRLGLEQIPLLQLHGPSMQELAGGLMDGLEEMRRRGWFRLLGVNSFDPAVAALALRLPGVDAVMVDYNLLRPERHALISEGQAMGKAVLAGMPLAMGHGLGAFAQVRGLQDIWYVLRALKNHRAEMRRAQAFAFMPRAAQERGLAPAQVALAHVLTHPGVSCAVFGTTRISHLRSNLAASGLQLDDELRAQIAQAQALL